MGMSIDKAVDRLEYLHFEQDDWEYGELTEDCSLNRDALRLAIDVMRKYQKIKEILNSAGYIKNGTVYSYTYDEDSRIKHIREVIEDEKID